MNVAKPKSFQEIILRLQNYWSENGCREDEQAFAEMNAANPIFVEDAVRLFCKALKTDDRIGDFRVIASHQESLHSHDAISIMCEGPTFDQNTYDPKMFSSLIHVG